MADTGFKLARAGEVALLTIDNGEDHTKPTFLGRAALASLERALDELERRDFAALVLTGKPFVFCAGADITEFPNVTPELARTGSRAGHGKTPTGRPAYGGNVRRGERTKTRAEPSPHARARRSRIDRSTSGG